MSSNSRNNNQLPMRSDDYLGNDRPDRLIGIRKVLEKYDVSKSTLYNRINDGLFPLPVKDCGRALWWESEVDEALRIIGGRSENNKKEEK